MESGQPRERRPLYTHASAATSCRHFFYQIPTHHEIASRPMAGECLLDFNSRYHHTLFPGEGDWVSGAENSRPNSVLTLSRFGSREFGWVGASIAHGRPIARRKTIASHVHQVNQTLCDRTVPSLSTERLIILPPKSSVFALQAAPLLP